MADLEQKNKILSQTATAVAEMPAAAQEKEHKKPKDRKGARVAFNLVNFLGLHWIGNFTLSLWITYNLLPKKSVQSVIGGMSNLFTPVAKVWSVIFSPVKNVWHSIKTSAGFKNGVKELSELEREEHATHNARSAVETACMCIAGSIILFPVKYLENHKEGFLNTVDGWLHPGKKHDPKKEVHPVEEKETWWNLIRARLVALVPIFIIDNQISQFNNRRFDRKFDPKYAAEAKGSVDTFLWNKGAKFFDKNEGSRLRDKLLNFFARKQITVANVQQMLRPRILSEIHAPEELHFAADYIGRIEDRAKALRSKKSPEVKAFEERAKQRITNINAQLIDPHAHVLEKLNKAKAEHEAATQAYSARYADGGKILREHTARMNDLEIEKAKLAQQLIVDEAVTEQALVGASSGASIDAGRIKDRTSAINGEMEGRVAAHPEAEQLRQITTRKEFLESRVDAYSKKLNEPARRSNKGYITEKVDILKGNLKDTADKLQKIAAGDKEAIAKIEPVFKKPIAKIEDELKKKKSFLHGRITSMESRLTEGVFTDPNMKREVERTIFSEQTRLFAKEWYLTLMYTGLLFLVGKTPIVKNALDKLPIIGTKKKHKPEEKPAPQVTDQETSTAAPAEKAWAAQEEKRDVKKEKIPAASFTEAAANSQNQEATVSLR